MRPEAERLRSSQRVLEDSGNLEISEIFSSIQGEGPSAGARCLFVRLALCNLRCSWCDTKYTWEFRQYRYSDEVHSMPSDQLLDRIAECPEKRIVITGGEPLLQRVALSRIVTRVPGSIAIEVETNGTISPTAELIERVDQWNVSPKLSHSGEPESRRVRPGVLAQLRDTGRGYLKIVVQREADLLEVEALVIATGWPRHQVLLMPEAQRERDYRVRAGVIEKLSEAHGFGFSPRLHVLRWDGARGR